MSDAKRLQSLLDSGSLMHPIGETPSIVDCANALHSLMNIPDTPLNDRALHIKRLIGEPDHLVLVLADGFGMNFVETLDADAFIPNHLATEMRTVFPSTTPIVLTSLATGQWPSSHSVIGWFVRLRQIDAVSTIIIHIRTQDKRPLSKLGVNVADAYPVPSRIGKARRDVLHLMPKEITGSVYSNYWSGGARQVGYDVRSPHLAVQTAIKRIATAGAPTCVYLYLPHVDHSAHVIGASHPDTLTTARQVDALLGSLAAALPDNARLVMTADHGHLDAPRDRTYAIDADDEIIRLCESMPTGDHRAVYVNVAAENMDAFRRLIHQRFGDDFLVLTAQEVEDAGLFGPESPSEETRRRMGSALVLSTGDAVLDYRAALGEKELHPLASHHGGLTPAEMRIPLVVA